MDDLHYLYLITRDDGEKYVGVTINPHKRKQEHFSGRGNKHLINRIFNMEILDTGSREHIYGLESEAIRSHNCSLNIAPGGRFSFNPVRGEQSHFAILNEEIVLEIKQALLQNRNINYDALAKKYSVSRNTISGIANNRNWKHVGPTIPKRTGIINNEGFISTVKKLWLEDRLTIGQIAGLTGKGRGTISRIVSKFNKKAIGILGELQV